MSEPVTENIPEEQFQEDIEEKEEPKEPAKEKGKDKDKDSGKRERRRATAYMVSGLLVSLLLVFIFSNAITMITAQMTYDATLAVKKTMLEENVENMVSYLDACTTVYTDEHPDATKEEIEKAMYDIAYRKIYSETHMDGTYMWIQKVLDYNGGDGYAVRLIHPNLSDTEGDLLSTNTVNQDGSRAYEEELEGVKKDGHVFLDYHFKKLESDEVTEKVTYSRLYKPFDWIICMGVNIDDLDHYQEQARENIRVSQALILASISLTWIVLLYLMFHAYQKTSGRLLKKRNKELSEKLQWDAVTGANSRIYGEKMLEREFDLARTGIESTLIAMLDVDYFKQFNDNYGHDLGDRVLKEFVTAIRSALREGDSVIRWGGDEFIAIIHNVKQSDLSPIGDRIVDSVRAINIPEITGEHRITTSVGMGFILPEDDSIADTVARIDEAAYAAKNAGRDNWKAVE
ncbi:MAG: sensor domain-containing diguanylate cyclase [Lachnospiraceae bacterium]|nr:sensor domain-containing diguanylate cyclase [Lachnospiraceae bacterium]